ncbi:MAG TPA: glycoside hydrolase family 13 protein [Cytophagales bacterium]|nr:glycoside hydrolase family 13 protein [Cytophagales bacterium]
MNKLLTILFILSLSINPLFGQKNEQLRIEPPFWWTDMKNDTLQLMIYGTDISKATPSLKYPGVTLLGTSTLESSNYLFVDLLVSDEASPGKIKLSFKSGKKTISYNYELKERSGEKNRIQGFSSSDLIYLIMPDRFANGDPKNDNLDDMIQKVDRTGGYTRHGGDLKGISDHLDYMKDLGVTAMWINPVLENNMPEASYHGYAITNLYKVDPRFGSNEDYVQLIAKSHDNGIKIIMDMVHNHIGLNHWWMKDLPSKDWVHQFEQFTKSNYHLATVSDPHASEKDKMLMEKGWFDTSMPDLNQSNSYVGNYLIQNTLWWIEYAGIDGIRMDTYPYPNADFMAKWSKIVMETYPSFNIVGEVWIHSAAMESFWLDKTSQRYDYTSGLPSVTDFPINEAMLSGVNEPAEWNKGLGKLYHTLAEDFLYKDPNRNVIFLDNHDMTRTYTSYGEDLNKFKQGITLLMTLRGIPQLYYGTEILMTGDGAQHSEVRKDFPGGWAEDNRNAFTKEGRTTQENEAFEYVKALANWRKNNSALMAGKLTHFIPEEDTYVYFRHTDNKSVMVVLNTGKETRKLNIERFAERLNGFSKGRDVVTGKIYENLKDIEVEVNASLVLELSK